MSERPETRKPPLTPEEQRQARLAEALRANLRRRKAPPTLAKDERSSED